MKGERGVSRRERLELIAPALTGAALGLLATAVAAAGRACALAPLLALPVGLWLCRVWRRLGERGLSPGLEGALGRFWGRCAAAAYLLWSAVLLTYSAHRYAGRLDLFYEGEGAQWLWLGAGLALALWLGRGDGAPLARSGRIFFLATAATVVFALALALPGVKWENLWPPAAEDWMGLPAAAGLVLSLAGYGVYALCLPRRPGGETRGWPWVGWGCAALAATLFIIVGTFGPTLAGRVEEPFLLLLEGVQVPGAFRRGEAMLSAVLTLADLTLLALLSRGCVGLSRELTGKSWPGWVLCAAAFAAAGWLGMQETMQKWAETVIPAGNLTAGVLLPTLAIFTKEVRKRGK